MRLKFCRLLFVWLDASATLRLGNIIAGKRLQYTKDKMFLKIRRSITDRCMRGWGGGIGWRSSLWNLFELYRITAPRIACSPRNICIVGCRRLNGMSDMVQWNGWICLSIYWKIRQQTIVDFNCIYMYMHKYIYINMVFPMSAPLPPTVFRPTSAQLAR